MRVSMAAAYPPTLSNLRLDRLSRSRQLWLVRMHMVCFPCCLGTWKWNRMLSMSHGKSGEKPFAMLPSVGATRLEVQNVIERCKTSTASSASSSGSIFGFEELHDLLEEVKTLADEGKRDDATVLLRANYECANERVGAGLKGLEEAATLCVVALGYMAIESSTLVKPVLDELSEVVNGLNDAERHLDSILEHMGMMYAALGQSENSILVYRRALSIAKKSYGKNSMFLVSPLLGLAKAFGSRGRVTKATDYIHRAIAIVESNEGSDSAALVEPLLELGNLLVAERKTNEVEELFIRVVNICTRAYGRNDGRTGMAMCYLAPLKYAKGNVDEAIQLYRDGLQMIEQSGSVDLDDKFVERTRIELAELLHVVGRQSEGREVLEECLRIVNEYRGNDHPDSVTHLINLATSYSETGNYTASEQLLRRSLRIAVENSGPENESITVPMLHLAIALYNLQRFADAESLALEVLRIRQKTFGKDSVPVGEALDCLVSIQMRLERDPEKLIMLVEMVLRIQECSFGKEAEELMRTLQKLMVLLEKVGREEEKERTHARLCEIAQIYNPSGRWCEKDGQMPFASANGRHEHD